MTLKSLQFWIIWHCCWGICN